MRRAARAFAADERGVAATLMAICMFALIGSSALAVDLGDIYMRSRQLQGVADLAAMAAVQSLDPSAVSTPQATAAETASLNPWPGGIAATATTGVYTPDATLPAAQRFVAGQASPNAVQVTLRAPVHLYFAGLIMGRSSIDVARTAYAARAQYAAFSIGSGLAALNGGVANALLSGLTGSQVQLSVLSYQALASAQLDLLKFMPVLRTDANLQAGSYSQLLSTSLTPPVLLNAIADTLSASGQSDAASAARQLASASAALPALPLSAVLDLGPYDSQDHSLSLGGATLQVGALNLVSALLQAANASRQVAVSLDGAVPGVAKLTLWLAIGQRPNNSPWLTVAESGEVVVRTAQMRAYLLAQVAPTGVTGASGSALVQLPIYLEAASAAAKLQDIQCPADPSAQAFDLSVSPSLGTLTLGQVDPSTLGNFAAPESPTPATLLNLGVLTASAFTQITIGGGQASWQPVRFTSSDVAAGAMKSVYTSDVARATVASLLSSTTVGVTTPLGGVNVNGSLLGPQLQALLVGVAPSLDGLLAQVEALTGVRLGEADVWADGLRCHGTALVS